MNPAKMFPHSSKCGKSTLNSPQEDEPIYDEHLGAYMPRFSPISINHVLSIEAENDENYEAAYKYQSCYLADVVEFLRCQPAKLWNFSLMNTACQDLRFAAKKADEVGNEPGAYAEKAAKSLKALYKICLEDHGTNAGYIKRQGMLIPINQILRIYFKLEKYALCNRVIKSVKRQLPASIFFRPLMVMLKFHIGRLALVDRHYEVAFRALNYAYNQCSPKNDINKRMILVYLLPVEMIINHKNLMTKKLVDKYNLSIYWDLYTAIQADDLRKIDKICEDNRKFFSNEGLLVILEELKDIVYTNIFKKVYFAQPANFLPIASYQASLNMAASQEFNDSEIVHLLTSLILKKKIKALLPHGQGVIVLCLENPFPNVCQFMEEEANN